MVRIINVDKLEGEPLTFEGLQCYTGDRAWDFNGSIVQRKEELMVCDELVAPTVLEIVAHELIGSGSSLKFCVRGCFGNGLPYRTPIPDRAPIDSCESCLDKVAMGQILEIYCSRIESIRLDLRWHVELFLQRIWPVFSASY